VWSSAAVTAPASESPSPNLKGPDAGVTPGSRSATAPWPTPACTSSRTSRYCRPGPRQARRTPRVRREDQPASVQPVCLGAASPRLDKFGRSTGTLTGLEALGHDRVPAPYARSIARTHWDQSRGRSYCPGYTCGSGASRVHRYGSGVKYSSLAMCARRSATPRLSSDGGRWEARGLTERLSLLLSTQAVHCRNDRSGCR